MSGRKDIGARLEAWAAGGADAALIEQAMPLLTVAQRTMLHACYIEQTRPEVVCRRLSIPARPAAEFVQRFRAAQAAVEAAALSIKHDLEYDHHAA